MHEETWETMTDHCANFHADWLFQSREIFNWTNKNRK